MPRALTLKDDATREQNPSPRSLSPGFEQYVRVPGHTGRALPDLGQDYTEAHDCASSHLLLFTSEYNSARRCTVLGNNANSRRSKTTRALRLVNVDSCLSIYFPMGNTTLLTGWRWRTPR
jgi:hypothetical protein